MTSPVAYQRLKNFTQFALDHTANPYSASDHDAELNAVQLTLAGILANRALIQRDDGALANDSVHPDSLSTATLLLIEAAGSAAGLANVVRGLWATGTAYTPGQIVQHGTTSYICAANHTSGDFDVDYPAGKWVILGETAAAGAAAMSFSPTSGISAITVQGAIEELDAEKAGLDGSGGRPFAVGDAAAANQATSMAQIQRNSLKTAIGTGTADALLATIASGLTILDDGMEFIIEAPGANSITAPTFELTLGTTSTGAKTVVKGGNVPLVGGDIASNKCHFVYDLSSDKWILLNPLFPVGVSSSDSDPAQAKNLGLSFSVGFGALSASVVTASGGIPTSGDSIQVAVRSSNPAAGTFNVRVISSAVVLVISSGSTLGHSSNIAGKIHWYLIDNAGALELAASTRFFGFSGIASTTAEGGAGGADADTLMYSAAARSNVPYVWVGETTDTQSTAGTWAALPATVNTVPRGMVDAPVPSAIFPIFASVSGNAMTLQLLPCVIDFRSPSLPSGSVNRRVVSTTISTVISSGSTGGTISGVQGRIYLIAMDVAGTVELAWINLTSSNDMSEASMISTTAEGGAGGADMASTPYSTIARSGVPYRVVGFVEFTQATAGTWASAPSTIQGAGGQSLARISAGVGSQGQSWQYMTTTPGRSLGTTYTNTSGKPIAIYVSGNISAANGYIQLVINGSNSVVSNGSYAAGSLVVINGVIVPHGYTYSIGAIGGTLSNLGWWELR